MSNKRKNKVCVPAILKEDRTGFNGSPSHPVIIPKGTIVDLKDFDLKDFMSVAYSGSVMLLYDPSKRNELFEPLDPDDVF